MNQFLRQFIIINNRYNRKKHQQINKQLTENYFSLQLNMAKQDNSVFQFLQDIIQKIGLNPFQDYYIFLIFRFIIYIYLLIKLSDIFLGYAKPNLRTRVLRKFQFVYGQQILKQFDKEDMQQLQITINNTILNATKDLTCERKYNNHKVVIDMRVMSRSKGNTKQGVKDQCQSERKAFKRNENGDNDGLEQKKKNGIKFKLDRNDYYDHLSSGSILSEKQQQKNQTRKQQKAQIFQSTQHGTIQGQSEQQNLSPKSKKQLEKQSQSTPKRVNSFRHTKIDQKIQSIEQPNIHYPQELQQGMILQNQQKFVHQQQDLLHLSENNLYESLMGNQSLIGEDQSIQLRNEFENFPSIIKTESTNMTEHQLGQFVV